MIVTKVQKQPKVKNVAAKPAAAVEASMLGIGVSQDIIRQRAFQIYESRGRMPGLAIQDWLRAENQILAH